MGSHKAFDASRISQSLAILDAWRASALPLRAFATQHHHRYDQLRAWLRHEPRWRGVMQPKKAAATAAPSQHSGAFQRMHLSAELVHQDRPHPISPNVIRIDCANSGASRSARIHFHPSDDGQWLARLEHQPDAIH